MNRYTTNELNPLIQEVFSYLPEQLSILKTVHFYIDDSVFNDYNRDIILPNNKHDIAVMYFNAEPDGKIIDSKDYPTIYIPERYVKEQKATNTEIIHELGHYLDYLLSCNTFDGRYIYTFDFDPVTEYAKVNRDEAFAEAFCYWLQEDIAEFTISKDLNEDINTFFNKLSLEK